MDRFGRRLFETFFKSYTEKVWGIPCQRIGADWAAQRIRGLNLTTAIRSALFEAKKRVIKTFVDESMYPRLGAGQFYENMEALSRDLVDGSLRILRFARLDGAT